MGCGMVTPDEWDDVVAHNTLKQPQEEPDDVPDYIPLPPEIRVPLFPESPSVVSNMSILHSVNFLSNRKRIEGVERDKWGKIIRPCGVGECTYKSSNTTCMKNHRESKHGVEPPSRDSLAPQGQQQSRMGANHWRWMPGVERDRGGKIIRKCGIDGCSYMARATNMKSHQATRHDVNVKWFTCGVGDCYYRAKSLGQIKRHKQTNHNIGIQFHKCAEPGCDYRSRQLSAIKKHMERTHTAWLDCDVPNCDYKAKRSGNLKQHKLFTHSVGVTWHPCVIGGCTPSKKFRTTSPPFSKSPSSKPTLNKSPSSKPSLNMRPLPPLNKPPFSKPPFNNPFSKSPLNNPFSKPPFSKPLFSKPLFN
ncbi:hypothetical protein TrVE_jg10105 [Triparma verrucosa]|uniref:C2H2-type domain-containing protein n=1 Tax=Triparma verrucosa TaxID=1606542 RepID=A0A9W7F7I4_9STRA|nr:hypothetical protein TrVE_jg10105 [Triparma verrucosa]